MKWIVFHGHLDYFQKLPLGPKHKTMRPWHSEVSQPLIYYVSSCVRIPHE